MSALMTLIGGGPQGTLIGGLEYQVQSNDNANIVQPENRFKYIDDLFLLQLICLSGLLMDYNFHQHVASDVGIEQTRQISNTGTHWRHCQLDRSEHDEIKSSQV